MHAVHKSVRVDLRMSEYDMKVIASIMTLRNKLANHDASFLYRLKNRTAAVAEGLVQLQAVLGRELEAHETRLMESEERLFKVKKRRTRKKKEKANA